MFVTRPNREFGVSKRLADAVANGVSVSLSAGAVTLRRSGRAYDAGYEVFPGILMPAHVSWYARFARNRMVLAHTDRSRGATEISPYPQP